MAKTIKMEFQPMILHVEGALKIFDEDGHLAKLDIVTLKYKYDENGELVAIE